MSLLADAKLSELLQRHQTLIAKVLTALIALGAGYYIIHGQAIHAGVVIFIGVVLHFILAHSHSNRESKVSTQEAVRSFLEDIVVLFFVLSLLALISFELQYMMLYVVITIVLYFILLYYKKLFEYFDQDTKPGEGS